jgi:F0F1-type ATP synthase assembly protein I
MEVMADNDPSPKKQWVSAEKMIMLGIALPAATFAGWLLGGLLDRWLHKDWIAMAGLIFGTVAGFAQFIRGAMSAMKSGE